MNSETYDSLDEYNAGVVAARAAYAADQRVEEGLCACGCGRKKDGHHRLSCTCRQRDGKKSR